MKIISQSSNQLVLKEGSTTGTMIGIVFVIAGALVGYFRHASNAAVIWFALAFVVIGIGLILFSSAITVSANRTTGQLLYEKKRLVGGSNATYAIPDILRIETRKQWRVENSTTANPANQNATPQQPMLVAQSVIVFKDGRELPLDHQKTSSSTTVGSVVLMGGQGKEVAIANQVANFLNVPFQEIAPPGFGGLQINIG